jgi:wyosine [tRNA(Phe)-imidazoG37] synthetase (radical SAM superfamily)
MLGSVREAFRLIDRPFLKLDAGTEEVFRKINRPAEGVHFQEMIEHMVALDGVFTQTVFVDGDPSNITDEELAAWFGHIKRIKPAEAHIYSIDRPVPDHDIRLVSPDRLEGIAEQGTTETGITIKAYYPRFV